MGGGGAGFGYLRGWVGRGGWRGLLKGGVGGGEMGKRGERRQAFFFSPHYAPLCTRIGPKD